MPVLSQSPGDVPLGRSAQESDTSDNPRFAPGLREDSSSQSVGASRARRIAAFAAFRGSRGPSRLTRPAVIASVAKQSSIAEWIASSLR
ncbi:MAG: hypothetical protein V4502_10280, partial [Pseudomonadota bacterium]